MKSLMKDYKPYKGFFDLRDFNLTKKEFAKFWRIQRFFYDVHLRLDDYKNGLQFEQIQEMAAIYQVELLKRGENTKSNQGELF